MTKSSHSSDLIYESPAIITPIIDLFSIEENSQELIGKCFSAHDVFRAKGFVKPDVALLAAHNMRKVV